MAIDVSVQKRWGDFSLDVSFSSPGGIVGLLGASGCGKSKTLQSIAGIEKPDRGFVGVDGKVLFDSEKKIDVPVQERRVGYLFQDYALFPNMTVEENIFHSIRENCNKAEKGKIVGSMVKRLRLTGLERQKPGQLSGGQQQRVALARALCIEPDVLLMDEPLSNLDAKLRVEMRTVIKNIQHNVGITTIYVTHDQEEAMAVSDRIAVMKGGVIQHIGTPKNIYQRPANLFVSTFIGRSNVIKGNLSMKSGTPALSLYGYEIPMPNVKEDFRKEQEITVSVRPEELLMAKGSAQGIEAVVDDCVFLGLNTHYFMHLNDGTQVESIQESTIDSIIPAGTKIFLEINAEKVNLFTADGETNILNGVCNDCVL